MFIASCNERVYELIYGKSFRIICDEQKKENDKIKTWREMNDGMYWATKDANQTKMNLVLLESKLPELRYI